MKAVTSCENTLYVEGTRAVPGKVRHRLFVDNSTPNNSALMLTDFCVRKIKTSFSLTQKIVKFKSSTQRKSCDCYHWTWPIKKFLWLREISIFRSSTWNL